MGNELQNLPDSEQKDIELSQTDLNNELFSNVGRSNDAISGRWAKVEKALREYNDFVENEMPVLINEIKKDIEDINRLTNVLTKTEKKQFKSPLIWAEIFLLQTSLHVLILGINIVDFL